MSFDDELLLTSLGAALETRPAAPSAAELDDFLDLVAGARAPVVPLVARVRRHPARSMLVAAAVAASLVVVGGAGALATGSPLPNSLRAPVRALGLPVDDSSVARTRSAMAELRAALEGTDDARVKAAALALAAKLRTLSDADRAEVEAEARALIRRADERLNAAVGISRADEVVSPPPAPGAADPGAAAGESGVSEGDTGAADDDGHGAESEGAEPEAPGPEETPEPEEPPESHESSE